MKRRETFRVAVPADAPALSSIALAAKRHWGYPADWLELWRGELTVTPEDIHRDYFCIAEIGGHIAGFVSVSVDGRSAEITHLWVRPEFIGQGVGRALLQQALNWCASRGLISARVVADPNALGFYLTAGGKAIGRQASVPAPRELPVLVFSIRGSDCLEQ